MGNGEPFFRWFNEHLGVVQLNIGLAHQISSYIGQAFISNQLAKFGGIKLHIMAVHQHCRQLGDLARTTPRRILRLIFIDALDQFVTFFAVRSGLRLW